ncbi:hypothetical protein GE061_007929 [Apolygus lucorum]|uniref:Uncharacterized protein n=1 Tax=Apolygus lucorum TaxID=248454 RepID=A0A8S9WMY1_APOLU|nr:hypothetical protein GE061_007929 [Apolygus lucorum]
MYIRLVSHWNRLRTTADYGRPNVDLVVQLETSVQEMDAMDLSKACRLCLKGGEVMCPIFGNGPTNGTPSLPQRIMSCAQIKLSEGDGMPNNVCTTCLAQVDRSYQFKLQCERSDVTLRGSMKAEQLSDDDSEEEEQWDMTKFTPEVIIKEDNDLGDESTLNGSYGGGGDSEMEDYHHQNLPPPPLYPLATMLVEGGGLPALLQHPPNMAVEQFQDRRQQMYLERAIQQHQQNQRQQNQLPNQPQQSLTQELLQPPRSRRCRGGDKLFKCRQCNKSYSFSSALSRHKAVHNTALRPHVCQICNKGFTQVDKLIRHQKTHTMDFFMACDLCQRPFKSFAAYQKHRMAGGCMMMNNGRAPQQPETQQYPQRQTRASTAHQDPSVAPPAQGSPPPASAPDDSSAALASDQSNADESPSPDQQQTPTSGRNSGKGKPEFQCKVCDKMFATRGSLEVHSTIHTGVRPFVCSVCNKSFRHKVNLMEHFQRKHSLVRPYICDVCAARFVTKQELVRHYRKHIGD